MKNPKELKELTIRLRRNTTNPMVVDVCDALDELLARAELVVERGRPYRNAYMREYMRQWRKAKKATEKGASADAEDVHHR